LQERRESRRETRHREWRLVAAAMIALMASGCVSLVNEITQPHTPDARVRLITHEPERTGLQL
jgi:hypothetical protein